METFGARWNVMRRSQRWIAGLLLGAAALVSEASDFYRLTIIAESSATAGNDWRILRSGLGINNAGFVTWSADRLVNGAFEGGLFVGDGATAPTLITLSQSGLSAAQSSINNAGQGQVAFTFSENINGVSTSRVRIWDRGSGTFSDLYTCNQQPTPLPCSSNTFSDNARVPVIRNVNPQVWQIVAAGPQTTLAGSLPSGFSADGIGVIAIARRGTNAAAQGRASSNAFIGAIDAAAPGQLGLLTLGPLSSWSVRGVSTNDLGNIAFLSGTAPNTSLIGMVGVVNPRSGSASVVPVADTSDGTFVNFGASSVGGPAINNLNEVGFAATISSAAGNSAFVGDVSGRSPTPVAILGEAIPDSNGATFVGVMQGGIYPQAMNDRGQFAFYASIQRGATSYNAVIRADPVAGVSPGNPILPAPGVTLPGGGWRVIIPAIRTMGPRPGAGGSNRCRSPTSLADRIACAVPVWIDPEIATGYEYRVEAPGPNFSGVRVPAPLANGDEVFQVEFNGQAATLRAGQPFDFTAAVPGGVTSFRIRGIETSEALDPTNAAAFVTGLTFVTEATDDFSVTMVPIVENPDDLDRDGVPNGSDLCPNTAAGAAVDANGCSADQRDGDGDGVTDSRDQCPGTPPGSAVDANGCSAAQLDADGDGVPNTTDACPNTAPGASVDSRGCSAAQRDTDGDGVNDSADQCPNTPAGAAVNSAGCAASQLDSDGDSVTDNLDVCPATAPGTTVDSTGCPLPPPTTKTCDVNADSFVDYRDIGLILIALGQPAKGTSDPRDANRNGKIDLYDAALCTKQCTRSYCLPAK